MPLLRAFGLLLVAALAVWVGWSLSHYQGWPPTPEILGSGSAFEGNAQLPAAEIRASVDQARARVGEINQTGRWLTFAGNICVWLSFACTSAVTLVAAWFGRSPGTGGAAPNTSGLSPGATRTIGLLAGPAAVLTAGGTMATERGHTQFDQAKQAQAMVNAGVKAISDAKTIAAARPAGNWQRSKLPDVSDRRACSGYDGQPLPA